jgi:hypothetical protein
MDQMLVGHSSHSWLHGARPSRSHAGFPTLQPVAKIPGNLNLESLTSRLKLR